MAGSVLAALFIWGAATCSSDDDTSACPMPAAGSDAEALLQSAIAGAGFDLLYPCELPNSQVLTSTAVIGEPGRQQAELVWVGPFDLTLRQSQYPPAVSPDPAGASRSLIDLFPNTQAQLIEVNDASGDSLYHLFWDREGIYYEIQAFGPPQQRRLILEAARSLESP